MNNLSFGENLRRFRKSKKLSLKALAATLDVSFGFLGSVERSEKEPGKFLILSFEQFQKTGKGLKHGVCIESNGTADKYDSRLSEIITLWGSICEDQRDTLLRVAQGFSKEPPSSLDPDGGWVLNFQEKKST